MVFLHEGGLSCAHHVSIATILADIRAEMHLFSAIPKVQACSTVIDFLRCRSLRFAYFTGPVAAVSVFFCKMDSTLNMSLPRLSQAMDIRERKRGGGKLLRRKILLLFDVLMLIRSERTPCLPHLACAILFLGPFFHHLSCLNVVIKFDFCSLPLLLTFDSHFLSPY